MLWHLDDPVADGAAINTYLISKAAKEKGTTVLLNGMGGDEVFGGYRKHLATQLIAQYQKLPGFTRKGVIEPLIKALPVEIGGHGLKFIRWAKRFLRSAELQPLAAFAYGFAYFTPQEFTELVHEKFLKANFEDLYPVQTYFQTADKVRHLPLVAQMTYLDTKLFLPGLNLLYSDKASMAASLESRPPLIDKDIVEFASHLPDKYKINGKIQKYLLKKAAERYIPKEIIYRPKAPFGTPLRAWMKSGLDTSVRATFDDKKLPHNDFLKANYPLSLLEKHQKGEADYAHALWGCYAAAKWTDQNS
ncbi:MAG TPA: asparagine synthase C-terminal domain-containing protein, partial [Patescibacteria group bacterium]|nr:asparagine synthase C-terminal domain-containing protein [Patescibacteria group bacterium]